jgi:hypothetical protein
VLALAGLVYGIVYITVGGARARREAEARRAKEKEKRKAVASKATQIRPLDRSIHKKRLDGEMKRRVLGFYNSLDPEVIPEENHVHLKAEVILNHLGLLVELRDVNDPLPSDRKMAKYRGVISWFAGQKMKHPVKYLKWLARQAEAGRKVVLLDGLGASVDTAGRQVPPEVHRETLAALGIERVGNFLDDPHRIKVVTKDSKMVEFERKLPKRIEFYEQYRITDPQGKSYLRLARTDMEQSESDMVVVTSKGGYVAPSYVINESRYGKNYVMQWRIDPFRFFGEAFDVTQTPRPDFTTLGGARIYYSHIDGDGLPSITEVNRRDMCSDFTRTEVLDNYDLPVTVSFVVAGIEPPPGGMGNKYRLESAKRIAVLPNIEVAVHGFAHPMDWRAREQAICSYEVPGYKMSAEKEIAYATDYINREINPPGKAVMVMLWTGWCNPAEDQLAITYRIGIYNLNGGDPLMDGQFPSYLHLAPPIHTIGKHKQYFTSGPNDFILTEEWLEPYHRWANVIDTARRTDTPRRIYPINVYYHFYVVEKPAALAAMHDINKWVLKQEPAPLWVSQYVDIVRDFEDMRVAAVGKPEDETWRVLNSGYCRTIRFDRFDRHVDLERSRGVLGYRRLPRQRALYVHLDDSHDHTIALAPVMTKGRPFLIRHSGYVRDVKLTRESVSLVTRGYGRKYFSFANMRPKTRFVATATNKNPRLEKKGETQKVSSTIFSDRTGTLHWHADINGEDIKVSIRRGKGE